MIIYQAQFKDHDVVKLVKASVVPRAIAWISTVNPHENRNLAPFSFFTVASLDPLIFCISIGPGSTVGKAGAKDTLANIRATEEFVINIVSEPQANAMHESSKVYDRKVDEFEQAGLTAMASEIVKPPRVGCAPVSMECRLNQIIAVGNNHIVLGRLVCYHIRDDVYMEGDKVNYKTLQPIGRMAGDYSYVRDFFSLPNVELK